MVEGKLNLILFVKITDSARRLMISKDTVLTELNESDLDLKILLY